MIPPATSRPQPCVDRRGFIGACACTLVGLALGGCASLVARPVTAVGGRIELALTHYPELTEDGGSLKVLPNGQADPVYVLPQGDGTFAALSPVCTHLGCTVEIEGERLVCPCHGSTYDRGGKVLQGPAQLPLARYRTHLSADGVLTIDLRSRA
ncbi:MAG TPA: Rieske (2Fe-2S) protein [Gemmatimonadaceae bacterium]|nr:Rieske (2Fe-2S) protein [Gemmatimonadaceae bacterium]